VVGSSFGGAVALELCCAAHGRVQRRCCVLRTSWSRAELSSPIRRPSLRCRQRCRHRSSSCTGARTRRCP
jgi:hypothetical protein